MTTTQAKNLYYTDYYAWTQEQIQLLKVGKLNQLDIENLYSSYLLYPTYQ